MRRSSSQRVFSADFPNLEKAYRAGRGLVGIFGDSTTLGCGSGGTTNSSVLATDGAYLTCPTARIVTNLSRLNATQGCGGFGTRGLEVTGTADNATYYYPTQMTLGSGWALDTAYVGPWGSNLLNSTTTSSVVLTLPESGNRVELLVGTAPVAGVFTFDIDGTPVDTITAGTDTFTRRLYNVTPGAHTYAITRVSGTVYLQAGIRVWNSSVRQLQVENLGYSGLSAQAVATTNTYLVNSINCIGQLGHNALFVNLLINDSNAGRSAAQAKADLKTTLNACKANGIDLCPVIPTPGASASGYNIPTTYIDAIYQLCAEVGTMPPLDLNAYLVSQTASAADYFDVVHLLANGSARVGNAYTAKLLGNAQ